MALDEVLLDGLGRLRAPAALPLGRTGGVAGIFRGGWLPSSSDWPGYDTVRRWSGGGVVEHGADLTFSLLVPRALALATLPAAESYRRIHEAVGHALARAGDCRGCNLQKAAVAKTAGSRACFENPVAYDLLLAGDKIAGGAQRRTRRGLLHQGSIQGGFRAAFAGNTLTTPNWPPRCRAHSVRASSHAHAAAVEIDAARSLAATKYRHRRLAAPFLSLNA